MNNNKYLQMFPCIVFTGLAYGAICFLYLPKPLISVLCLFALYYISKRGLSISASKREWVFSAVFGVLFTVSVVWGKNLVDYGAAQIFRVRTILLSVCLCPFVVNVMKLFFTFHVQLSDKEQKMRNDKAVFFLCWFVFVLSYIPVLLAFYPGIASYDVHGQLEQVFNNEYTLKHPWIHTEFMGIIIRKVHGVTGNWNLGVFAHSLAQTVIMTGVFSYLCTWIYKFSKSKIVFAASVLFYMAIPIHPLLAITTTKDTMFSAGVSLVVVKLLELGQEDAGSAFHKKKQIIVLAFLFFLMLIFRNNAMYAVLLWLPLLLWYVVRRRKEGNGAVMIISLILAFLLMIPYQYALKSYVHAEEGPEKEKYSVPIQQMARVYNEFSEELPEQEKETLEALFHSGAETLVEYEARKADVVKERLEQDVLVNNWKDYCDLWINWGLRYPVTYFDAWMNLINGYFCFDDEIPDQQTYRTYIEIRCSVQDLMDIGFESKIPGLFDLYYALFELGGCQKVPFLSVVCQLAFYDWALILTAAYLWQKKRYHFLLPLALLLTLLATNLLGPVAILRYIYPVVVCFPLMIFVFVKSL